MIKVLCIVQARMGSERLQGKVIKPIIGKPMILYTMDRLSKSKYISKLILATSDLPREQPLVDICRKSGYEVFRGEESNVLKRYKDAADCYLMQATSDAIIIRVTGDCPLIDPTIIDNVITYFMMNNYDYVRLDVPESFIRGFDVEVFSRAALEKVYGKVNKQNCINCDDIKMYSEHVTLYMYKHPEEFKIGYVKGNELYHKDYRLCVDTRDDFELVKNIVEYFNNEFIDIGIPEDYIRAQTLIETWLDLDPE